MRDAATVLGIIHDRGRRGLPLEDVYRQLYNPALYVLAYGKIAGNAGALTPGATAETADGMTLAKIQRIIDRLRQETYRWTPVRRVRIPKKNGTTRPLGIPTWSDKLLQEVIRLILEAYYEPQFSPRSHGFRPGRGCHTALTEIYRTWKGTAWFIEGDITGCFDNLDHEGPLGILRKQIHDGRFLRLIANLLRAGYLEDWRYGRTLSGSPQGGVVSPILANIYLDRLDRFVEDDLIPDFTRGVQRERNPAYEAVLCQSRKARRRGDETEAKGQREQLATLPSKNPGDPAYRRLRYVRYADDFLFHRNDQLHDDAFSIIARYEREFRGVVEYYRLASNLRDLGRLKWVMETSLTKTLAAKHQISVRQVYRRYRTTITTERGPRVALQVTVAREGKPPLVATWGRTDFVRRIDTALDDAPTPVWNGRTEIVERLLADTCELCGSQESVQVHHVRALKDLRRPGQREKSRWVQMMAARQRKTLVVCQACHTAIHAGRPPRTMNRHAESWRAGCR